MANMELITSVTVGAGGAASVTLPATGTIPQTYTDLKVVVSSRSARGGGQVSDGIAIQFNGSTSNLSMRYLDGNGSAASSSTDTAIWTRTSASGATASTFGNAEFYIPNYTSSSFKSVSVDGVSENNATSAFTMLSAGLWSNTAAITSIRLISINSENLVEGTTAYLYGISNVTSGTKATGGVVSTDGTYYYHMFPFTGTFTPTQSITADYLVIAGGGGKSGTGAGAGGLRSTVGATGGGGSLESAISLTANTSYTVTVGAGGAASGNVNTTNGSNGGNSSIAGTGLTTITSTGGAGGMNTADNSRDGQTGGSGSGGWQGGSASGTRAGGQGTQYQGYAGGSAAAFQASTSSGGAGGGAGAVGGTPAAPNAVANGGNGVQITAFADATQTGVNGYYAGGGGSGIYVNGAASAGGLGGGGAGATGNAAGSSGVANTGGGAGAGYSPSYASATYNGGSGLVIIRYAI
jgi:hypothetical protein